VSNPATTADVVARWRPLLAQEEINAQTLLDDAWRMIKRRAAKAGADIEDLITADTSGDLEAEVIRVMVMAVLRVMKNPDGKKSESIDDYSWARDEAVAGGLLYISDDEMDDLIPGAPDKGRAFMIDPLADYAARFEE
jgi:hypothetical protein